jgi:hypothetical protein
MVEVIAHNNKPVLTRPFAIHFQKKLFIAFSFPSFLSILHLPHRHLPTSPLAQLDPRLHRLKIVSGHSP